MEKEPSERRKRWQAVVAEQEASGQSVREFCRERKLAEHAFYWWRRRLHEEKPVTYAIPFGESEERRTEITAQELSALLSGIDLGQAKRRKRYERKQVNAG